MSLTHFSEVTVRRLLMYYTEFITGCILFEPYCSPSSRNSAVARNPMFKRYHTSILQGLSYSAAAKAHLMVSL
jgi:hypothetical protein